MIFKAGKYYIGDPCYVLNEELIKFDNLKDDKILKIGEDFIFLDKTTYGDGFYEDNFENKYSIDSGMLSVIPVNLIEKHENISLGKIVYFDKNFEVKSNEGVFYIGNIIVDTNNDWNEHVYDSYSLNDFFNNDNTDDVFHDEDNNFDLLE